MKENIVLEAVHLKKVYNYATPNAFEALHDINFQVHEGEFVGIMDQVVLVNLHLLIIFLQLMNVRKEKF